MTWNETWYIITLEPGIYLSESRDVPWTPLTKDPIITNGLRFDSETVALQFAKNRGYPNATTTKLNITYEYKNEEKVSD